MGFYNLEARRKKFKAFEKRVKCVMASRDKGKSFGEIAKICKISTRQQVFHIYQDNKDALSEQ